MLEGDQRKRKNGGSSRSHIGDAVSASEANGLPEGYWKFKDGKVPATVVLDDHMFAWLDLPALGMIVFHEGLDRRHISRIHRELEKAGLQKETDTTVYINEYQLRMLKQVQRAVKL